MAYIVGQAFIASGTKVVCQKCKKTIALTKQNIHFQQKIDPAMFHFVEGEYRKLGSKILYITKCCNMWWFFNGSLYTDKGWQPQKPPPLTLRTSQ